MPKTGIQIVEETPGNGPELKKGDRVRLRYDIQFNRGDFLVRDEEMVFTVGDRNHVAGFRYGLEGLRVGGTRRFRASPHLCYRDAVLPNIPRNAVLVFSIRSVELATEAPGTLSTHMTPMPAPGPGRSPLNTPAPHDMIAHPTSHSDERS